MTASGEEQLKKGNSESVSYASLFRYATAKEIFLLFIGFLVTFTKAICLPIIIIVYSEFTSMLVDRSYGFGTSSTTYFLPLLGGGKILTNATEEENSIELYNDSIAYGGLFTILSTVLFLSGMISVDLFNYVALKQVIRIRIKFFENVLRQDISWHDMTKDQNFGLKIVDDIEKIRDGIAEKLTHYINLIMGTVITMIISYIYGWKLALALSIYIPIVILTNYYVLKYQSTLMSRELESNAKAGNLLEEILSAIRTVVAFGGEKKEVQLYDDLLGPAQTASKRRGAFTGFGDGILRALMFLSCAAAIWYGINLILDDRDKEIKEYNPATMLITFFGIIVGADNLAKSSPFMEAFATAKGAAVGVFKIMAAKSEIDPMSTDGKSFGSEPKGDIEFEDVFFKYPSRKDVVVLRGICIKIESGQTVALVGSSGCGKSTCIQLIQRFYDPDFGFITLDGLDIRKYNINWLRSNMAIVGQEPVLFLGTIVENIRNGKPNATDREVEEAAKIAGAHEFIKNLPDGYQTRIGEKGTQLSGGQKQRIAIARALIQNPKILLLDEATSALDYESEKLVQQALDVASKGRTTIVVSHRLSAIRGADKIVYIDNGKVLEQGNHEELMNLNGHYHKMVTAGELDIPEEDMLAGIDDSDVYKKSFDVDPHNLTHNAEKKKSITSTTFSFKNFEPELVQQKEESDRTKTSKVFKWIVSMTRPEWGFILCGTIGSVGVGVSYPCMTLVFSEFYKTLAEPDPEKAISTTRVLSIIMLVAGLVFGVACFLQQYFFNLSGSRLSARLKSQSFKSIIKQEMDWFDKEENAAGSLSARLSGDTASVQAALGFPLSGIIQAVVIFGVSGGIAFYFSWNLTLLCMACTPFIVGSVILEFRINEKTAVAEKEILEKASRVATEAVINIRTVAGLRREKYLMEKFRSEMQNAEAAMRNKLRFRGAINSFGQSIMFFGYGFALTYGGTLVAKHEMEFQNIMKVTETLLYGSMMLGQSLALSPALGTALVAGSRLLKMIDRKPKIQSPTAIDKNQANANSFNGVEYKKISFRYPSRPEAQILNNLSLQVFKGKTVALVGHSGCGKSTCIQLLQRFYEPETGRINIEKGNIASDMHLDKLRSNIGIVSQEPTLFERTIAQNIAYGDNSRVVSMDEVIEAAKQANAHDFITTLPSGYETNLGSRGTQLSGGQKQRIAIARALIRNPNILLLDEATSALDLQSEKVVQMALDSACSGRTCIVIAHRLSTVQGADLICVFEEGRIAEMGNHQQLLAQNGLYYKLYMTQSHKS